MLLCTAVLLGATAATAAPVVHLVDATLAPPPDGSVQVRTLGQRALWIPAPGTAPELPADARTLRADDGDQLYVVREAAIGDHDDLRTLARWDGFRVVALDDPAGHGHLSHHYERLTWLTPPPRPRTDSPDLARRADPAAKAALIDEVDLARYTEIVRKLSGDLPLDPDGRSGTIATRYTYSEGQAGGIDDAVTWLTDGFESAGYTVTAQPVPMPGWTTSNLIAIREGVGLPDEIVVVGAHYDAISEIPSQLAPGAEDNASGTAAVLHLAEVFADVATERSVHFVCFGGEEQGLYGSQAYVDQLATNGWTVAAALTMDMVSAWQDDFGVLIEANQASEPLMVSLRDNVVALGELQWSFSFNPFGSDHIPFLQAQIPALLAIEEDWAAYGEYHTSADTFDEIDPALGYAITRALAGTIVDQAGLSTSVGIDDPDVPAVLADDRAWLGHPIPNPFNPRTRFEYAIPREGHVSLRIYDARGRIVRTLVEAVLPAGRDDVVWDGTDRTGRAVASGLYFSRLEFEGTVVTRRMALAR
jgi:hypothetical protein